jgi:hypothetical protein
MRPQSLAEVARFTLQGGNFDFVLRSFLDAFQAQPDGSRLVEEPPLLAGAQSEGGRWDAYLAATAESLATEHRLAVPSWAWQESRKLRLPWFALPWAGLRAVLLQESPAAFRSRNLFVSANALSRV